jgi:hypothetical protein
MTEEERPEFDSLARDRERSTVPTPAGRWIMGQRWEDLLFMSWPIDAARLEPFVHHDVRIDEMNGSAWISVVPFWMQDAHFRGLPPIPFLSSFPEVNVRTYVSAGGHRAVWFLSLDTESHINVFLARHAFHLPYVYAKVEMDRGAEVAFRSERRRGEARFEVTYRPDGAESVPAEGTLEHFLTERYSMMGVDHEGKLFRGDIQHAPWKLRGATHKTERMDLLTPLGLDVAGEPMVFHAAFTEVVLWPPVRM